MPTANERKALWFLAMVALSGSGVRLWRARTPAPPVAEAAALGRQLARVDSVRAAPAPRSGRSARPGRKESGVSAPQSPAAPVDLDRATRAELETLPGIGPTLAGRIIANRDSLGSFGSMDALCGVKGIGPVLTERLRPLVTFTGPRRPLSDACTGASRKGRTGPEARSPKPR